MPTYITLLRYTQKGIENIKDSPSRLEQARRAVKSAGGDLKSFYFTMGSCDGVVVSEAPDDAAYARIMVAIASKGFVRTETLRAFSEDEYRSIVSGS